ncbi:hypothetical protein MSHOH_2269 [Methanosarcina horonobensis HB-1 = JCM 15518]|uniref:Serine protease n=1 Tax=Methanosarcina horonobensis HB-1 = JCM 15518 TaxID=1434110 RepID=A0A0E3SEW5_9EURY|nr:hypothetical protein [Methanosarcina horonobensis]AKB78752.1 hypothetical protein MSHOH_2269 [Methanosarcina horonobensis HB-1 = JCM 15518]
MDGMKVAVTSILKPFDLALIELPSNCMFQITELGSASELEQALLVNDIRAIKCRVVNAGTSLLFLGFQCYNMPEPGDSGSPILQSGKVIGLISSITMDNCMGTAISSSVIRSMEDYEDKNKDETNKVLLRKQKSFKETKLYKGIKSLLRFSNNLQHDFSYYFNPVKV